MNDSKLKLKHCYYNNLFYYFLNVVFKRPLYFWFQNEREYGLLKEQLLIIQAKNIEV